MTSPNAFATETERALADNAACADAVDRSRPELVISRHLLGTRE